MTIWRLEPRARIECREGAWWAEIPDDDAWVHLGFAPCPVGPWQTFMYHVHRGRLEGYGWPRVVPYAWRNRRSFEPPKVARTSTHTKEAE